MESSNLVGDHLSPESTVSHLLSSSGHLRSSCLAAEHNATFKYRDKNYDSASAVLDAYITDFENTHQNSKSLTGGLILPQSLPSISSRFRVGRLRNKDVLRESLTDTELDFLNLPISSLHHSSNRDRLSMTTDELISIPFDGSMPVTHTTAFIQGLLSQSGDSHPRLSSSRPAHRTWDRLSNSHAAPRLNQHQNPHPSKTPRSSRCRGGAEASMLKPESDVSSASCHRSAHRTAQSQWVKSSSLRHLPHRFSSNMTDMDCSGITSMPNRKCPAWIQRCGLSESLPPTKSELWDDHGILLPSGPIASVPSWVAELEEEDSDQIPVQVDSQQALGELRLQFAEQISLLAAEKKTSDIMETLFRDNKIESLIQKADQVLNSLSRADSPADQPETQVRSADYVEDAVSPLNTEEWLLCSSSHCPPFTLDSAAAAAAAAAAAVGVSGAVIDRGTQTRRCSHHVNNILKQPGPVEAMKQMLFRLQAVETELQRQHATNINEEQASAPASLNDRLHTEETPVKPRPEAEAELESFPGGQSLQRALHHLSRLKVLVEEPREKHGVEKEEKDEDEGRFSSASADELIFTRHKPSS